MLMLAALSVYVSQTYADSLALNRQAEQYVQQQLQATMLEGDRIEISVGKPDSRLKLPSCSHPPEFTSKRPLRPGRFSLKASCERPKRWRIHLSGKIRLFRDVVISERAMPRDTTLRPQDLQLAARDVATLRQGFYTRIDQLSNFQLKRSVQQKQVLTPQLLKPPLLVRKDDEVVINAGKGSQLNIRMPGIALQDGHHNQQISVRNKSSGRVIKARVTAPGEVRAGR